MAYIFTTRRMGTDLFATQSDAQFQNVLNEGAAGMPSSSGDPFDVLGTLSDLGTDAENLFYNALPESWGGEAITPSEQASINAANAASITQAATSPITGQVNTDLANAEIAQSQADTQAIADQANSAGGTETWWQSAEDWLSDNWQWVFLGAAAFLLLRPDKAILGKR